MSLPNPGMDFTPFDVLPAASLDDMVENIEALADGSGLDTNAIGASKLATSAIKLGRITNVSSNQAFTVIGSDTAITGFSLGVTIPAGGREVEITITIPVLTCTGATVASVKLWSGSVGGTQLGGQQIKLENSASQAPVNMSFRHTPSAGAITYIGSINPSTNNVTANMSATQPGQMWADNK